MKKTTYMKPAVSVVEIQYTLGILAGSGEKVYGQQVSASYQMSRSNNWIDSDDEDF